MHYVILWSDGLEGLVMCAVSCGEQVQRRYISTKTQKENCTEQLQPSGTRLE